MENIFESWIWEGKTLKDSAGKVILECVSVPPEEIALKLAATPLLFEACQSALMLADEEGNLQVWGSLFSMKWGALAGKTIIASVEEIVDTETIRRNPELTLAPGFRVAAVVHEPWGAHPGHVFGHYDDDRWFRYNYANFFGDDDAKFKRFMDEWIYGVADRSQYIKKYIDKFGYTRLMRMKPKPFYTDPINYGAYSFDTLHMDA